MSDAVRAPHFGLTWNAKIFQDLLNTLTATKCHITIVARMKDWANRQFEPFYGACYTEIPLNDVIIRVGLRLIKNRQQLIEDR